MAIIGAGFGGLGMGVALRETGIERFLIFEEGSDVGGVWRENTYPGASCDVPSHLYSYSFDPYRDSTIRYPDQASILDYLRGIADRHGLTRHLRTNTPIVAAHYDDSDGWWTLTTAHGAQHRSSHVVWAVGQLHRPHLPDILGRETFCGNAFHSARWDHTVDLGGRDIAVVGTGSSAAQMVPELARIARSVTVYQRTPSWILPKPPARFGPMTRYALERFSTSHAVYRAAIYHFGDFILAPIMTRGWSARPATWMARAYLRWQIRDRELRAKLTPRYRIGEKRIVVDRGFYPALNLPHVELVTAPIDRVTATGIRTTDGTDRVHDTIVWATGFRAPEFLAPIRIRGRGGMLLQDHWEQGANAFLGLAVPGFPSMWLLAGPNAFNAANSNPTMKEFQTRYIVRGIRHSIAHQAPVEVSANAMAQYQQWLDAAIMRTVWPDGIPSWYKSSSGRVTNPWPAAARVFDRMTRGGPGTAFKLITTAVEVDPRAAPPPC